MVTTVSMGLADQPRRSNRLVDTGRVWLPTAGVRNMFQFARSRGGTRFGVAVARGFKCHNTARQLPQIWTSSPQIDIGGARHSLQRPSPVSTGAAGAGR
jgi:hypothetical protein